VEAYKDATREPYSYLFVDLRPEQDEDQQISRRDSLYAKRMSARVKKYLTVLKRTRRTFENATESLWTA